ncbi:uncharacterized protein ALTATR162_LOCUS470 [Alternaria atra]|jgi:hypothetical protein|uniref:Heterokaryon incompatibility domain-containing protein n=1 Tax=Alternaria atra TaxID=119953 RepID=A0A8J2HSN0_9PLEO|nr:uncharacterized protein ALTATR162_LOCUS470 [Alternaria atra]CAG5139348.1 unnamed protein product [Alternaria atra]
MLAEDKHIHQWPWFPTQGSQKGDAVTYDANRNFDSIYEAFFAIERSPWWTRMWTVQEAILPKTGLLTYDTWTMSLQSVIAAGQSYFGHFLKDCCQHAALQLPMIIRSTAEMFCRLAVSFYGDRKGSEFEDNLYERHTAFGYRECKDPRDKVYGLLGIAGNSFLTPDYTLSKSEVFFQATYSMLSVSGGTLQSLTGPQYGPAPGKWATWVRNFDAPSNYIEAGIAWDRLILHNSGIYNACNSHRSNSVLLMARARPESDKASQVGLETVGRRVGIVAFASQARASMFERHDMRNSFRRWMLEALDWDVMHKPAYASASGNTCEDPNIVMSLWRTLLGGTGIKAGIGFEDWDKFVPTAISLLAEFLAWLREEIDQLSYTLNSSLFMSTHGRCYFKAENDDHGLCYPGTCIGDEVWVLDGGRVPFILRPAHLDRDGKQALRPLDEEAFRDYGRYEFREDRRSEMAPEGYYQFIGDCYFDGVMNGEAVRNSTFREQTIILV